MGHRLWQERGKVKTTSPTVCEEWERIKSELFRYFFSFFSSMFRQHKLEEALLFSGQFAEALQALVDWLYRVEPQLAEDQPVHGDLDLVSNLMDLHKV